MAGRGARQEAGHSGGCVRLSDIATGDVLRAFDPVAYAGPAGGVYYTRVRRLPLPGTDRHVAVTTPPRIAWQRDRGKMEDIIARRLEGPGAYAIHSPTGSRQKGR